MENIDKETDMENIDTETRSSTFPSSLRITETNTETNKETNMENINAATVPTTAEINTAEINAMITLEFDPYTVLLAKGYIRAAVKNGKGALTTADALRKATLKGIELLKKAEERLWEIHANDGFVKEYSALQATYLMLLNSKSPMTLEMKNAREAHLQKKWGKGGTQVNMT